jgi:hypothetical protein
MRALQRPTHRCAVNKTIKPQPTREPQFLPPLGSAVV